MKLKNFLIILFLASFFSLKAQKNTDVLMTIGGNPVTVGEFKYIYEKNNGDKADYSEASINEYLDLYKKFKLKVAKAKDMKLDTIQALNDELAGYRTQLANSYLMDKEVMNNLYKELYDRMDHDIDVSHIVVTLPKNPNDSQRKAAEDKINEVYAKLKSGERFEKLAAEYSDDKLSASTGGRIGFFTAMMPNGFYEFENAMYSLPAGQYSEPFTSKLGYHIIKVNGIRPAKGRVEVAQILIRKEATDKTGDEAKTKINEVYTMLNNGADFDEMVAQFSDDKQTKTKGGVLPEFGINQYSKEFEEEAFGLKNVGDYTKPFETNVGWHILKKVKDVKKDNFDIFKRKIEPKLKKDERYEIAQNELIEGIKKDAHYTLNTMVLNEFIDSLDADFYTFKWKPCEAPYMQKPLINFDGGYTKSLSDFAEFCKKNTRIRLKYEDNVPTTEVVNELLNQFSKEEALNYEQQNLEAKYPDFKSLMREYEEGILLFEATKMEVWDKANQDTLGLYQYYENNKNNYTWNKRAKVSKYILHGTDQEKGEEVVKYAEKSDPESVVKEFGKEFIEVIPVEYDLSSNELYGVVKEKNAVSNLKVDKPSGLMMFKKIEEILPARRKTLEESRGYVIADYQSYLEDKWVRQLKNDFNVEVNDKVLKQLIKK